MSSDFLPPLASASASAAHAYAAHPSALSGQLNRAVTVDRSGVRRARRASHEALTPGGASPFAQAFGTAATPSNPADLRLPTPLPGLRAAKATAASHSDDGPLYIDLHLPTHSGGSQSARSPGPGGSGAVGLPPHAPSSLAAITQDTNARVTNLLLHFDGHRRDSFSSPLLANSPSRSKSHRLILGHMSHMSPQQLAEEQNISRLLTTWHPQKSARTFAQLTTKIRNIVAERSSLFDGAFAGKVLVENEATSEELEKKRRLCFKLAVPSSATIVKVDLDVSEGRVEMYVSCGEPVHLQREKERAWSLRGGVGHHTLTIHGSDPQFQAGETFFVTLYALQASAVVLKATLGGKNKNMPLSGLGADDGSSSLPTTAGPASSGTRLTARQAGASRHAPSTRNIRKMLEARVRALGDDPKALAEFMGKIAGAKRRGVHALAGAEKSNSIHPPAHLSLQALHRLNEQEAAADADAQALERSQQVPPGERKAANRTAASRPTPSALPRPHPLTRTSLDHIAHVQSITGVAALFFDTARTLQPPVLDEEDYILWQNESTDDAKTDDQDEPAAITSSSHHASLSTTLQSLISRVCARLLQRAQQLDSHRSSSGSTLAAEEAHFLRRCVSIYHAHLSEAEALLATLCTGEAAGPYGLARMLAAELAPPPRNFLLANAFDATDNRRFEPTIAQRRRDEWAGEHKERMARADERRERLETERREQTLAVIERKERERADAIAQRAAVAARIALQELQRNWLLYISCAMRHKWLLTARAHLQPMRVESFRKSRAARRIQAFVRTSLALKRKSRATLHVQAFRSLMLLMAANYGAVKRDRAANCIKLFIEQKKGVDSVARLVKNFRRRVGVCQRACKAWVAAREAKMVAWRLQFARAVGSVRGHQQLVASLEPAGRELLLRDLFVSLKRAAIERQAAYVIDLAAYMVRRSEELQKRRIISDHVMQLLPLPERPHVPVRLSEELMGKLMEAALAAARDQALRNLHTTTQHIVVDDSDSGPPSRLGVSPASSRVASALSSRRAAAGMSANRRRSRGADKLDPHMSDHGSASSSTPHSAQSRSRVQSRTGSMVGGLTIKVNAGHH